MRKFGQKFFSMLGIFFVISMISAGCANTDSPVGNMDSGTSSESAPSKSATLTIPDDFPVEIPIHPGEIVVSTSTGESNARTWVVEVLIDDLENARLKVLSDLEQANFVLQDESGIGTSEYLATLANSDYLIRLKVYLEGDTGEKEVMYIVTSA